MPPSRIDSQNSSGVLRNNASDLLLLVSRNGALKGKAKLIQTKPASEKSTRRKFMGKLVITATLTGRGKPGLFHPKTFQLEVVRPDGESNLDFGNVDLSRVAMSDDFRYEMTNMHVPDSVLIRPRLVVKLLSYESAKGFGSWMRSLSANLRQRPGDDRQASVVGDVGTKKASSSNTTTLEVAEEIARLQQMIVHRNSESASLAKDRDSLQSVVENLDAELGSARAEVSKLKREVGKMDLERLDRSAEEAALLDEVQELRGKLKAIEYDREVVNGDYNFIGVDGDTAGDGEVVERDENVEVATLRLKLESMEACVMVQAGEIESLREEPATSTKPDTNGGGPHISADEEQTVTKAALDAALAKLRESEERCAIATHKLHHVYNKRPNDDAVLGSSLAPSGTLEMLNADAIDADVDKIRELAASVDTVKAQHADTETKVTKLVDVLDDVEALVRAVDGGIVGAVCTDRDRIHDLEEELEGLKKERKLLHEQMRVVSSESGAELEVNQKRVTEMEATIEAMTSAQKTAEEESAKLAAELVEVRAEAVSAKREWDDAAQKLSANVESLEANVHTMRSDAERITLERDEAREALAALTVSHEAMQSEATSLKTEVSRLQELGEAREVKLESLEAVLAMHDDEAKTKEASGSEQMAALGRERDEEAQKVASLTEQLDEVRAASAATEATLREKHAEALRVALAEANTVLADELQARQGAADAAKEAADNAAAIAEEQMAALKAKVSTVDASLAERSNQLERAEAEKAALQEELRELKNEVTVLKDAAASAAAEGNQNAEAALLATAESRIASLESKLVDKETNAASLREELQEEVEAREELEKEVASLREMNAFATTSGDAAATKLATAESQIAALETKLADKDADRTSLLEQIQAGQEARADLEKEIATLRDSSAAASSNSEEAASKMEALETKFAEREKKIVHLREISELASSNGEEARSQMTSKLVAAESRIASLESGAEEYESKATELKAQLEAVHAEKTTMQDEHRMQNEARDAELASTTTRLKFVEEEHEVATMKVEDQKLMLESLQRSMQESLAEANTKVATLEESLAASAAAASKREAEYESTIQELANVKLEVATLRSGEPDAEAQRVELQRAQATVAEMDARMDNISQESKQQTDLLTQKLIESQKSKAAMSQELEESRDALERLGIETKVTKDALEKALADLQDAAANAKESEEISGQLANVKTDLVMLQASHEEVLNENRKLKQKLSAAAETSTAVASSTSTPFGTPLAAAPSPAKPQEAKQAGGFAKAWGLFQ